MYLYRFLRCFFTMFIQRIKVKGRLYRIFPQDEDDAEELNELGYRFGHTHVVIFFGFQLCVEFFKKRTFNLLCYDYHYLKERA